MANIILFDFESNQIRTGELDGNPVFCLSDLLTSMDSSTRPLDAKASIEEVFGDGVVINLPIIDSIGREQLVPFVFESGATFLISRSRTEKGKRMNRWLHSEVLPSIRKTGSYSIAQPSKLQLPADYISALKALVESEEQKLLQAAEIEILKDAVDRQSEVIDELFDYSSIIRIAKFNEINPDQFAWSQLKAASRIKGLEVKKAPCAIWGTKNLYSHDAWRLAYPGISLPESTAIQVLEAK